MDPLFSLVGAVLLTYFASRSTRRLRLGQGRPPKPLYTHTLALAAVTVFVAAIKLPMGQFTLQSVGVLLAAQLFWLVIDGARKQIGAGAKPG